MTHDFTITRMTVIDGPENTIGNKLLASFDMRIAGVKITNCVLLTTAKGTNTVKGPKGKTHQGHDVAVLIEDHSLHTVIRDKALSVFDNLSGRSLAAE